MTNKKAHVIELNKLVRNNIPSLLAANDCTVDMRELDHEDYVEELKKKMVEEAHEILAAKDKKQMVEELSDLLEAVDAFMKAHNLSSKQIKLLRRVKREKKGGFENRCYITTVTLPEGKVDSDLSNLELRKRKNEEAL